MSALRDRFGDAARSFGRVFRNPDIRRLETAWAVSIFSYWAYGIALAVFAYQEGGAAAVGLVGLLRFIPSAIASPFSAMLADRYRRERVLLVAELLRTGLVALTVVVLVVDGPFELVVLLSALTAVVNSAEGPAESALLPTLATTPRELTAANVVSSTIESLAIFGGPAIGGVLLAATSTEVVFAATAAAFLLSAFLISRVRVDEKPERRERTSGVLAEFGAGFVTLAREPGLRVLVLLLSAQTLVAGALNVLIVVTALQLLDLGEGGVGYLNSAVGIGGLIGALISAALIGRRLTTNFLLGILLWGIPIALIGLVPEPAPALLFLGLVGLGNTLVDVSAFTLLQRAVPDEVLARVFGAVQALWVGGIGIGAIVAPLLIEALGVRGALIVTGALLPVLTILSHRRLAPLDEVPIPERELTLLRGIEIFKPLPPPVLESLAGSLAPVRVETAREVFRQGEMGDRFYIVAEGEVEIISDGEVVAVTGPGGYFGEIALLRDVPRTATVRAKGDVELLALEREEFIGAVTGHAASVEAADAVVATR
ncbi:MAG TPA: MFS transporter, partial [Gaiellaceae bacterium]|nr:MFS transporter [Gaiellaceae bacterium]